MSDLIMNFRGELLRSYLGTFATAERQMILLDMRQHFGVHFTL